MAGGLLEKAQIGKRESLSDLVSIVDARNTQVTSMLDKEKGLSSTFHEWQLDAYATVKDPTVSTVDGVDVVDFENAQENIARIGAYIQYFRRSGKVSTLAQEVATAAGRPDEIGYARAKKLVEIKRDMECAILSSNEMRTDDGSVGYRTRGFDVWIQNSAQTVNPVPAAFRTPSAQINTTATASLVEDTDIQGMLTAIYDTAGLTGDYKIVAGSVLRRRFTDMTRTIANATSTATKVRTFSGTQTGNSVSNTTTVFNGDYGSLEILSSNWIGVSVSGSTVTVDTDRGYVLDVGKCHLFQSKLPSVKPLPDLGGGPRFLIEAWVGLRVDNPIGMGKFKP